MSQDSVTPTPPDLLLPRSVFEQIARERDLTMVLPSDSNEGWFVEYGKIVKFAAMEDGGYQQYLEDKTVSPFIGHMFFDVHQIRECRVRHVKPIEWFKNFGPTTLQHWMSFRRRGPNTVVRVYHLVRITHDLREFNKEFRSGLR